ncbi:MAG TPA: acyl-CoA dehydrogenase family protein, partial [Acidimicrobiia bacterium]|nr:acyl-CoA dehydrogenase family protein [Acidimicrobiia bacterium]
DLTRRFADVRFDEVTVPASAVVGVAGAARERVDAQLDLAAALTIAESIGAMRQLAEITVEYSKARIAFGRPIGSFQALKHILADVSFWAEVSLAAAGAAAEAVADARPTASEIVSIAKAYVGEAGTQLAQQCL